MPTDADLNKCTGEIETQTAITYFHIQWRPACQITKKHSLPYQGVFFLFLPCHWVKDKVKQLKKVKHGRLLFFVPYVWCNSLFECYLVSVWRLWQVQICHRRHTNSELAWTFTVYILCINIYNIFIYTCNCYYEEPQLNSTQSWAIYTFLSLPCCQLCLRYEYAADLKWQY